MSDEPEIPLPDFLLTPEGRAPIRKVLFRPGVGLGDSIVSEPAIRAIQRAFPQATVEVMLSPVAFPIKRLGFPGDAFLPRMDWENEDAFSGYEVIFDANPIPSERPFHWKLPSGAPVIYFYGNRPDRRGLIPAHTRFWLALQRLGIEYEDILPHLSVAVRGRQVVDAQLQRAGIDWQNRLTVLIQPGSGWPYKRWMPKRFAAVADALIDRYDANILLLVGPKDGEAATDVQTAMRYAQQTHRIEDKSLRYVAALLTRCTLLLGNDSGISHLAAALGQPLVAVFGPSNRHVWGPTTDRAIVRGKFRCCPSNPRECGQPCLQSVTVEDVLGATEVLLTEAIGRERFSACNEIRLSKNIEIQPQKPGGFLFKNREREGGIRLERGADYVLKILAFIEQQRSVQSLYTQFPDARAILSHLIRYEIVLSGKE